MKKWDEGLEKKCRQGCKPMLPASPRLFKQSDLVATLLRSSVLFCGRARLV